MSTANCENVIVIDAVEDPNVRRIAQLRDRHWTMLWISIAVILAAITLQTDSNGRVGAAWAFGFKLPELCGSRAWFGIECPGCGLTRSFISLAHGDVAASLASHRAGWLLALALLLQFPYRVYSLLELRSGFVERRWPTTFGHALIAILLVNWLVNLIPACLGT